MTILRRNPTITWRVERQREAAVKQALAAGDDPGERGTVLLIESGTMHQLNLIGGTIWQLLDGTRTTADVVAELAAEYDAPQAELVADVDAFTADLLQRGWLLHD